MYDFDFRVHDACINFSPNSTFAEIIQNVITVCTTLKGSRPMDRDFGITPMIIDKPMLKEQARVQKEIIAAVQKYEPRAKVTKIEWDYVDETITFSPHVFIRIIDA